jgi:ketosteroid isomerase-like protein
MRVIALLALALGLAHSAAAGQQGDVQPQLLGVLQRMATAFEQRDSAAVRALLAAGYTSTDESGVYDASQVVERVTNNPPFMQIHEQVLEPTTRLSAAGDSAVLHYHSILNLEMDGQKIGPLDRWLTVTFVRDGDRWLIASQREDS